MRTLVDEPVPAKHLDRDTSQMWRPHCQNDAWLPAEQVFFRVLQLPLCSEVELRAWWSCSSIKFLRCHWRRRLTFERVPVHRPDRAQQTVVVMVANVPWWSGAPVNWNRWDTARSHGTGRAASGHGYAAGGVLPDGAWIYPRFVDPQVHCTVAWWDEGVLQNITQLSLSSREHLNELTSNLTATTWRANWKAG